MTDQLDVASLKLYLNGREFTDEQYASVNRVTVEGEINLPTLFTINFSTFTLFDEGYTGVDLETFKIGDSVKISMGMDRAVEMLSGEISALEPHFDEEEESYIDISGYDRLYRLKFGTYIRAFKEMSIGDIVRKVAEETGLSPSVDSTGGTYPTLIQNNQSNYEMLVQFAERINFEMLIDDRRLIFRKSAEGGSPALTLSYPEDLNAFSARLRAVRRGSKVEVTGWDMKNKQAVKGTAASGSSKLKMGGKVNGYELAGKFPQGQVLVPDLYVLDDSGAKGIADAQYQRFLDEFIEGEIACRGNARIRAGINIEIKGLGGRFNGRYYVTSSLHSYSDDNGYTTTMQIRRTGI